MNYEDPAISLDGQDVLGDGMVPIQPYCTPGLAVMVAVALVIWIAGVAIDYAVAAVAVAGAAVGIVGVGIECS